ncbi:hypothetical protein A3K48_02705 [candidate division WOR-1 bacterium RIFOXYA12_FULL_52_29]|uniref:Uncharacterized protein n=1 Tax=candidate division WOR-1 bacterium RIFOXYC12_FULL_54_18 TaxID=1802584 RepID=A0A1F4T5S2_UNCSA|nr:MAG: hypothetical protein A3K44_02705 [candidate division WOR-1 bacterium RIFOXYA2_FULL_51_19]OGC17480.1 MAG: hypothetical protein A3K48_02705 [candidate division WOR-1 bacterium RIFOXYA12_FULL_52_29]OGC26338.1 MAG: hypothetical protein A3K32_02700 [candidate division WOR-1 bacterium RIFOXYB2_FULL_45_9]OGC27897.1 MAG: hypothetical protein A3K49_02705 [candidate division WOR-1 bacterium RIFOXYC12_FULL_54_18]OGC29815.1 MAG: hypothetical protein A2346_03630 [candidate division WOR-1 bacterium R
MEILGLLDTLESIILDSTKVPFSKKVIVDEVKVLSIIDKIRLVLQGGSDFAKKAIVRHDAGDAAVHSQVGGEGHEPHKEGFEGKTQEVIEQAYQLAKEIRGGADKYADEVLANLEATSVRILRTIKAGREQLSKTTQVKEEK